MKHGTRKVVAVGEVQGLEGDAIITQDIFIFEQTGIQNGNVVGQLRPAGIRHRFMDRIEAAGIYLSPHVLSSGKEFYEAYA